jgi:hypothetical protein
VQSSPASPAETDFPGGHRDAQVVVIWTVGRSFCVPRSCCTPALRGGSPLVHEGQLTSRGCATPEARATLHLGWSPSPALWVTSRPRTGRTRAHGGRSSVRRSPPLTRSGASGTCERANGQERSLTRVVQGQLKSPAGDLPIGSRRFVRPPGAQAVRQLPQPCRRAPPGHQLADQQPWQPVILGPLRCGPLHRQQRRLRSLGMT